MFQAIEYSCVPNDVFQVINKLVIQFCRISPLERISSFYRVVQIYFGLRILIIGLL